jgi:hypothetical protein
MEPETAVSVMRRFDRSEPIDTVASTLPVSSVAVEDVLTTAPLSAVMVTGTLASVLRAPSIAVTVTVAVLEPVFGICGELIVRMRSAVALAGLVLTNGDVPESPPPPPHPNSMAAAIRAVTHLEFIIGSGSLRFCYGWRTRESTRR